jgi:hypothetical protein
MVPLSAWKSESEDAEPIESTCMERGQSATDITSILASVRGWQRHDHYRHTSFQLQNTIMAYDNPPGMITAAVILEITTIACVALRFYTRWWKKSHVFTSDWLVLAAFICGTGLTIMQIYGKNFYIAVLSNRWHATGVAVKALAYPLNGTIEDPRAVTARLNEAKHVRIDRQGAMVRLPADRR